MPLSLCSGCAFCPAGPSFLHVLILQATSSSNTLSFRKRFPRQDEFPLRHPLTQAPAVLCTFIRARTPVHARLAPFPSTGGPLVPGEDPAFLLPSWENIALGVSEGPGKT